MDSSNTPRPGAVPPGAAAPGAAPPDAPGGAAARAPLLPLPVRCLLTVVAVFAMAVLGGLAGAGVRAASGEGVPEWVPRAGGGAVGVVVAVALAVGLARFVDRRSPAQLRLAVDRWTPLWVLAGVAVSLVAGAGAALAAAPIGAVQPGPGDWGPSVAADVPVVVALAFLVQGIPEEVLFRGYLVRTSGDRLPVWGVVVLSSVLFGSLHILSQSPADTLADRLLFVGMAVGLGALATAARLASGSVWGAVGVHGGFHVAVYLLSAWLVPVPAAYGTYLALLAGTQLLAAVVILAVMVRSGRLALRATLPPDPAGARPGLAVGAGA